VAQGPGGATRQGWLTPAGKRATVDTGGTGGYIPADPRIPIRCRFTNINMAGNPNVSGGPNSAAASITYLEGVIDITFDTGVVGNFEPTMSKHVYLKNITSYCPTWEPDKQTDTLIFDGGSTASTYVNGATGFNYVLYRNHTADQEGVTPRQLRAINTNFTVCPAGLGAYPL
jgi:hypothetical protein